MKLGDGIGVGDPACAFSVSLEIEPRAERHVTLLLAAASTRAEAADRLLRSRREGRIVAGAPNPFYENSLDGILAAQVLPQIFYPPQETNEYLAAAQENNAGVQALWSLGISGDHPILYIQIQNAEDVARALPLVRLNRKLRRSGIPTDVAIGYREGGAYDRPVLKALETALRHENCIESLNAPGGIHAVDLQTHTAQSVLALQTAARYISPSAAERMQLPVLPFVPFAVFPVLPAQRRLELDFCVRRGGFMENGAFAITEKPEVPWCHVLANLDFGTLVESGAGPSMPGRISSHHGLTIRAPATAASCCFCGSRMRSMILFRARGQNFRPAWRFGAAGRAKSKRLLRWLCRILEC
jgi:cyclic beta-1,2-glucan synthetase